MMEEYVFKAVKRTNIGKKSEQLRRAGKLPAIVYGKRMEPTPITLDMRDASRALTKVSSSHLVTLDIEGTPVQALVRQRQRDSLKDTLIHVDFLAVSMTEKLKARVQIDLQGESQAVKLNLGVLVTGVEQIEVECLPGDLPETIVVDVTNLKEVGDSITVKDLPVGPKVEVLTDLEEMVALITYMAAEEEVEEPTAEEPEVIEKGKLEEEE